MTRHVVRYYDLARLHASIRPELDQAFDELLESSAFVGARASTAFETRFAHWTGRLASVGVGSGTDALTLTLRAVGIGPGQEVIVPANTFAATAEAVLHVGAEPVFADVDPEMLLLTKETVDRAVTPRTAAVIPVHLYGHVVPLSHLESWRDAGYTVIEDAAQAHLATWKGRSVGAVGRATCFSFFPGKNLGALGDAGAIVSDDAELVADLHQLRDHGRSSKDIHEVLGWCSRLDGLQAAFLNVKLNHLERWTAARVEIAESYRRRLEAADAVALVPWEDGAVHHCIVVRIRQRDRVAAAMRADGIETGVHYRRALTQQPAFAKWVRPCPNAEEAATEILSLPCDPLMTQDDIGAVCESLLEAVDKSKAV